MSTLSLLPILINQERPNLNTLPHLLSQLFQIHKRTMWTGPCLTIGIKSLEQKHIFRFLLVLENPCVLGVRLRSERLPCLVEELVGTTDEFGVWDGRG